MKRIKLFIDGHWFDDPFQSPCSYLKGLYSQILNDPEFELYIAAANVNNLKEAFRYNENFHYLKYNNPSKYYRLSIEIPKIIKTHSIDISHYQFVSPLIKHKKEIVTVHDILFKDFKDQFPLNYRLTKDFLFRRSAKRADLIATVSSYSKESLLRNYNIPIEKLIITPNGISEEFLNSNDYESQTDILAKYGIDKYILCVSRFEPRKNHLSLVKAYVELRLWEQNIKLVLIGRKDIPVLELENYINTLSSGVKENILQLDKIALPDLISFYRQAKLFVYPSIAEGFGIPPLEAAVLKTKVLCSNTTAMADFSFFEEDLFNPLDIEELKKKILLKINSNEKTRLELIAKKVKDMYDWKRISEEFKTHIKTLFLTK